MKLALSERFRSLLEPRLPSGTEAVWYLDSKDLATKVDGSEVVWLDFVDFENVPSIIQNQPSVKWVTTQIAGMDRLPPPLFLERNITVTNGAGVNAPPIAEYVVMTMLITTKNFLVTLGRQSRGEWNRPDSFMRSARDLTGTRALILGYGNIGRAVGDRITALGVDIVGVRRDPRGEEGVIGPDAWRDRLGEFDWVIIAAASTAETRHMIGKAELAAMKPTARLINVARGAAVDQAALIEALDNDVIAGAVLDVTEPEPPSDNDPLWNAKNIMLTGHSSAATNRMFERAAALFLENLDNYLAGRPLRNVVDLVRGY